MLRSNRNPDAWLYACDDGEQLVGRANDQVPNYLFGQNPFLREYADKYRIPLLGALGGAETMYPEYRRKLRGYAPPAICKRYCGCGGLGVPCITDGSGVPR